MSGSRGPPLESLSLSKDGLLGGRSCTVGASAAPGEQEASVLQARAGEHRPAGERDAEAVHRERGENEQEKERGPRVPGRGVRRERELQEVLEIIAEDQSEEPEAE